MSRKDLFDPFPFQKPPTLPKKLIDLAHNVATIEDISANSVFSSNKSKKTISSHKLVAHSEEYPKTNIKATERRKAGIPHRLAPLSSSSLHKITGTSIKDFPLIDLFDTPSQFESVLSESDEESEYVSLGSDQGHSETYEHKYLMRMALQRVNKPSRPSVRLIKQKSYQNVAKFDQCYAAILTNLDKNINSNLKKLQKL